ncbi:hypothetical protein FA13DRAFT_1777883 [Coprinellus micaceus]|uniref:Uncharacterized protein n=1 Tax=Coprinellus micaceus TaxID=71717 RepID=A0A4Y7SR99_COPMI|nr:hypothetical protein FA13DRAFT_1777883 [Coprinellus micaceus]
MREVNPAGGEESGMRKEDRLDKGEHERLPNAHRSVKVSPDGGWKTTPTSPDPRIDRLDPKRARRTDNLNRRDNSHRPGIALAPTFSASSASTLTRMILPPELRERRPSNDSVASAKHANRTGGWKHAVVCRVPVERWRVLDLENAIDWIAQGEEREGLRLSSFSMFAILLSGGRDLLHPAEHSGNQLSYAFRLLFFTSAVNPPAPRSLPLFCLGRCILLVSITTRTYPNSTYFSLGQPPPTPTPQAHLFIGVVILAGAEV